MHFYGNVFGFMMEVNENTFLAKLITAAHIYCVCILMLN